MTSVLLLPDPAVLALVDLEVDEATKTITAFAVTTSLQASCPVCGHPAHRVQSNYVRTLADQPCSGQRVRWLVQVRRFWCDNGACGRKIFTERLATCAPAYARRTVQLATILCELAFALGGKAGERITPLLSMAVSHDTLLRLMKHHGIPTLSTPQVLGVDAFAWKKGRRYGTILIDQQTHTVVDLLPDREAETLAKWLKEHPGVKVISRDRAGAYAEGARQGAPEAQQVSDRFHLLLNLGDALKRLFERKHESLKQIAAAEHLPAEQMQEMPLLSPSNEAQAAMEKEALALSMLEESSKEVAKTPQSLSPTAVQAEARRAKRQNRYEEVIRLCEQGVSQELVDEFFSAQFQIALSDSFFVSTCFDHWHGLNSLWLLFRWLAFTQWAYQSSKNQGIEEINDQFSRRISSVASTGHFALTLNTFSRHCVLFSRLH